MLSNLVMAGILAFVLFYLWRKSKGALLGLAFFIIALLVGMHYGVEPTPDRYPSGKWRHRVTLEVQTPEGIKKGSVVRQVSIRIHPDLSPFLSSGSSVKGEAVVVDLGAKGLLFGLMRSQTSVDGAKHLFTYSFPLPGRKGKGAETVTKAGVRHFNSLEVGTTKEVSPEELPMLVRFRDIKDPKSVELVDPANLAATYGAGYALKSATIEITDDPVTTGIEKVLPSFGEETGFLEWQRSLGYGHKLRFGPYDFSKGVKK